MALLGPVLLLFAILFFALTDAQYCFSYGRTPQQVQLFFGPPQTADSNFMVYFTGSTTVSLEFRNNRVCAITRQICD